MYIYVYIDISYICIYIWVTDSYITSQHLQYLHQHHLLQHIQHLHLYDVHLLLLHLPIYLISNSEPICYIRMRILIPPSSGHIQKCEWNRGRPLLITLKVQEAWALCWLCLGFKEQLWFLLVEAEEASMLSWIGMRSWACAWWNSCPLFACQSPEPEVHLA